MRPLLVFFGDDYHGGTTYSTATIAKELVRRGHDVHAYVNRTSAGQLARDLRSYGVTVHEGRAPIMVHPIRERRPLYKVVRLGLELARRFVSLPACERELGRIIDEADIDLVAISSGAIVSGARAAQAAGIPYVWHRREFMEEDHGLEYYPWAQADEHMRNAACLVCVSRAVEDKMRRLCPTARTEVVYNGIDQDVFFPADDYLTREPEPLRLMFSGGIKYNKGTFLLLDALAQLDASIDWTLDVFGAEGGGVGEGARDLDARCRELGLAERVRYRGSVSNIADEYRAHDVQVVSSLAEAFGRVTAESMLCGCAVVGSNSGGTPELISDNRGYLFEQNDAASLARALELAARDLPGRRERVSRALGYARENFSVNAYADGIEAVYRSVVA